MQTLHKFITVVQAIHELKGTLRDLSTQLKKSILELISYDRRPGPFIKIIIICIASINNAKVMTHDSWS